MKDSGSPLRKVVVALDFADWDDFSATCRLFGPRVGVLKVGLEAYARWGHRAVEEARLWAHDLFLDLKLHDIPNTVAGAVRAARDLGANYLTVHAAGGRTMLGAARDAAGEELRLLAVTVLTHLGEEDLATLGMPGGSVERAREWARLARDAGCQGAVCSAAEVGELRRELPRPFLLVTPGIRFASDGADDQKRVGTPAAALEEGADLLVIGRSLTRAPDREAALEGLFEELTRAEQRHAG